MNKNNFSILLVILCVLLIPISCKKDEIIDPNLSSIRKNNQGFQSKLSDKMRESVAWFENVFSNEIKEEKSVMENENNILIFDKKADWTQARAYKKDNIYIMEGDIAFSENWISFTPAPSDGKIKKKGDAFADDPRYLRPDIRAIIVDINGSKTVELMVVVPDLEYLNSKSKHNKVDNSFFEVDKNFSGTIQYYNWEGAFKRGFVFEKGKISGVYNEVKTEKPIGGYRTCTWTYTTVVYNTYGSSWVGWDPYWYYNGSYVNGTNSYSEWTCVETSGDPYSQFYGGCQYGCGGGGTSTTTTTTYGDDDLYDGIDPIELLKYPKFDCLYQKFITGKYSLFNNTIGAFRDHQDNIIFKYTSGNSSTNSADYTTTGNLYVNINTNHHPLVIAHDILHEGIHAAIHAYLRERGVDVSLKNYGEVMTLYGVNKKGENIYYSHETYIGNNYIESIGNTLASLDGFKYPKYYYWGIAYDGISGHIDREIQLGRDYYGSYKKIKDKYSLYSAYSNIVKQNSSLCQ